MSDGPPETAPSAARASVTAVVGVMGAVALMLLLVTWAATIGPQQVVTDAGNPPSYAPLSPSSSSAAPNTQNADPRDREDHHEVLFTVVTIVATMLATIVMLAVLLTVLRWLLTREWRRSRSEPEPEEVEFDPLDAPSALAEAMLSGASSQRHVLATGSPRNAIVECWLRFEDAAATVGVRRLPWETSSEFTLRVLDGLSADASAVSELAELYRDARYSRHEITEENRHRAQLALDVIHRSLGSRAGAT